MTEITGQIKSSPPESEEGRGYFYVETSDSKQYMIIPGRQIEGLPSDRDPEGVRVTAAISEEKGPDWKPSHLAGIVTNLRVEQ